MLVNAASYTLYYSISLEFRRTLNIWIKTNRTNMSEKQCIGNQLPLPQHLIFLITMFIKPTSKRRIELSYKPLEL